MLQELESSDAELAAELLVEGPNWVLLYSRWFYITYPFSGHVKNRTGALNRDPCTLSPKPYAPSIMCRLF